MIRSVWQIFQQHDRSLVISFDVVKWKFGKILNVRERYICFSHFLQGSFREHEINVCTALRYASFWKHHNVRYTTCNHWLFDLSSRIEYANPFNFFSKHDRSINGTIDYWNWCGSATVILYDLWCMVDLIWMSKPILHLLGSNVNLRVMGARIKKSSQAKMKDPYRETNAFYRTPKLCSVQKFLYFEVRKFSRISY